MERFTVIFFKMVCQQIFEKDKLLFSFMLAYKQMESRKNLDFRMVKFFIIGNLMKLTPREKQKQKERRFKELDRTKLFMFFWCSVHQMQCALYVEMLMQFEIVFFTCLCPPTA